MMLGGDAPDLKSVGSVSQPESTTCFGEGLVAITCQAGEQKQYWRIHRELLHHQDRCCRPFCLHAHV